MWCLITAESEIFTIFVVAYLYYAGKSINGPTPREVLEVPIFISIALFSNSFRIVRAERAIERGNTGLFAGWWFATIVLGAIFVVGTAHEWDKLIYEHGLTISSSLFGTTFYSMESLMQFHPGWLLSALAMHVTMCLLVGLLYGAMLPMLPTRPIILGGIVGPLLWTGLVYHILGFVNPLLDEKINWVWFAASQVAFGVVAGLVVVRHNKVWTTENLPLAVRAGLETPGIMHPHGHEGPKR